MYSDAPHIDGGEEAGEVADDASAEGDEEGVAVCAVPGQLFGEAFDGGEAFVGLACGDLEDFGASWKDVEAVEERFGPELGDLGAGNEEGAELAVA